MGALYFLRNGLFSLAVLLAAASLITACAGSSGQVVVGDERGSVSIAFSDHDRWLIHDYYRRNLPPGLAKRETLPPGLRKQVARRGHLPPGLSGQGLPQDLESRLSPLPDGYIRLRIGTDVVLMDRQTRVILDIIQDIGH